MSDPKKIPPTLAEVREFLASLNSKTDAEHFILFYEERDWKAGREKMKNWQAAARRWHLSGWGWPQRGAGQLSEWEIKQKQDRLRDLRERKRAITNPGGSAFSVSLDATKRAVVAAIEDKIDILKKELGE